MIPPISASLGSLLPSEWAVGPLDPASAVGATGAGGASATPGTGFAGALSHAVDALEQGQATATSASQALATGQLADPTQAVTAVENASLEMQLASQMRTKLTDAVTNVFSTSV